MNQPHVILLVVETVRHPPYHLDLILSLYLRLDSVPSYTHVVHVPQLSVRLWLLLGKFLE